MTEKELLYQVLNREVSNLLSAFSPAFRVFSPTITNYIIAYIEPYVDAFTNKNTGKINTNAAGKFVQQEVNEKVDAFIKKFEAETESNNEGKL